MLVITIAGYYILSASYYMSIRHFCISLLVLSGYAAVAQTINYSDYTLALDEQFNYASVTDSAMLSKWFYGPMDEDWSGGIEWFPANDASHLQILTDSTGNHYLRIIAEKMRYPVPMPKSAHPLRHFWSGMLVSKTGNDPVACKLGDSILNGYRYGLFEIRAKIPKGDPLGWDAWPAFWMRSMGAEIDIIDDIIDDPGRTWMSGFIDWWRNPAYDSKMSVPEVYSWDVIETDATDPGYESAKSYSPGDIINYGPKTYKANRHYPNTSVGNRTYFSAADDLSKDFHIFGCEWSEEAISFYLDGKVFHVNRFDPPFRQAHDCAMKIAINLSVMGNGDKINTNSEYRMNMDIDYVRVWKRKADR